jgi:hypothetical protein
MQNPKKTLNPKPKKRFVQYIYKNKNFEFGAFDFLGT